MLAQNKNAFTGNTRVSNIMTMILMLLILSFLASSPLHAETYKTQQVFLTENFAGKVPEVKTVWLQGDLKKQVNSILSHPYGKLRVKYWLSGTKSAWILEEIGKERPITSGIIINNNRIAKVEILAFRESRGWEVKYPFFLKQFLNAGLKGNNQLDRNIDGITGATLSVRAVRKLSRLALLLHKHEVQRADMPKTASN